MACTGQPTTVRRDRTETVAIIVWSGARLVRFPRLAAHAIRAMCVAHAYSTHCIRRCHAT
jgi:hypothetical protein